MTTPELLPCPFCGGADLERFANTVSCDCGARGATQDAIEIMCDPFEAIAAWNTRAPMSPAVLAELPEVKALIAAETERCEGRG